MWGRYTLVLVEEAPCWRRLSLFFWSRVSEEESDSSSEDASSTSAAAISAFSSSSPAVAASLSASDNG